MGQNRPNLAILYEEQRTLLVQNWFAEEGYEFLMQTSPIFLNIVAYGR